MKKAIARNRVVRVHYFAPGTSTSRCALCRRSRERAPGPFPIRGKRAAVLVRLRVAHDEPRAQVARRRKGRRIGREEEREGRGTSAGEAGKGWFRERVGTRGQGTGLREGKGGR